MTQEPRGPDFGDATEAASPQRASTPEHSGAREVPDFGDAPEYDASAAAAQTTSSAAEEDAAPDFADGFAAGPAEGPDFADSQEPIATGGQDPAEPREESPGAPLPARASTPGRAEASGTGRMRAIVGGVTILAILAIGLAVFLPREKSDQQPQAGTQTTQAPTPSPTPTPTQQYQQQNTGRQELQTDDWAQQAHQAFLEQRARAEAQSQSQGQGQGQAVTGNSGGNQTASNADGGTGYSTCPDCGGEGTKPCPMKHLPNGHMLNPLFWAEERYYSGNDPLLPEDADMDPCPYCGGKLRVPCDSCGGTGKVPDSPGGVAPGAQPGGSGVVDGAIIDSVARQLMGAGGQ